MKTKTVLVVEDSEDELFLLRRGLEQIDVPHALRVVNDGQAAVDYLSGHGIYADRAEYPLPAVVFLDIRIPKYDGHEVLEWIRRQPRFKRLPVIMFSNSAHHADIERAHSLDITSYITKQLDFKAYRAALKTVLHYWLEVATPAPVPLAESLRNQPEPSLISTSESLQSPAPQTKC
jgi:CheY-like chemotaxis protein